MDDREKFIVTSGSVNEPACAEFVETVSGCGAQDALVPESSGGIDGPGVEGADVSQE